MYVVFMERFSCVISVMYYWELGVSGSLVVSGLFMVCQNWSELGGSFCEGIFVRGGCG